LNVVHVDGRPTTRKLRYVEMGYLRKLFEVYTMDDTPLAPSQRSQIDDLVLDRSKAGDLVIVADFGHGLIDRSTIEALTCAAKFLAVNAQTNGGNAGYNLITKYRKADYICIDAPEARLAVSDKFGEIPILIERSMRAAITCDNIIITHGAH